MQDKKQKPKIKVEEIIPESQDSDIEKTLKEKDTSFAKVSSFIQLDQLNKNQEQESLDNSKSKVSTSTSIESEEVEKLSTEEEEIKAEEERTESEKPKSQPSSEEIKKWLEDIRPDTTKEVEKSKGLNLKPLLAGVFFLFILGLIAGGIIYYTKSMGVKQTESIVSKENIETISPTLQPTEKPRKLDLKVFKVNILNGSGIKGEAAKVKNILVENGFSDENLTTGNADSYNYKQTIVKLKQNIEEEVFESIKNYLKNYEVIMSEEKLPENFSFDVVITIGSVKL